MYKIYTICKIFPIFDLMWKISIAVLTLSSFFLASCSIDWGNEKDSRILELERKVSNEVFEKTKECFSYKEKMLSQLNQNTNIYSNRDYKHLEVLKEIFYSPIIKSCIYTTSVEENQDGNFCKFYKSYNFFSVNNDLDTYLKFQWSTDKCDFQETQIYYEKSIKSLKGE